MVLRYFQDENDVTEEEDESEEIESESAVGSKRKTKVKVGKKTAFMMFCMLEKQEIQRKYLQVKNKDLSVVDLP